MPATTSHPVKVMIRTDREAGLIRAFIAMDDESDKVELSTFNLQFADKNRHYYEIWLSSLTDIFGKWCTEVTGCEVDHMMFLKPESKN